MYKKSIKWKPLSETQKILQVYSKGIEYSLVSDDNQQCHSFVWCKDFLHDVVYSSINQIPFEIYRFKYDPIIEPNPSIKNLKILLSDSKNKKLSVKIPNCLNFINQIESQLGMKHSIVKECSNPPSGYHQVFLFVADKRWINAPPMLSLYSLFLRIGFSHEINDSFFITLEKIKLGTAKSYQRYDKKWLLEIQETLEKIFKIGDKSMFSRDITKNYPKGISIDNVHNKMGIIGYSLSERINT